MTRARTYHTRVSDIQMNDLTDSRNQDPLAPNYWQTYQLKLSLIWWVFKYTHQTPETATIKEFAEYMETTQCTMRRWLTHAIPQPNNYHMALIESRFEQAKLVNESESFKFNRDFDVFLNSKWHCGELRLY